MSTLPPTRGWFQHPDDPVGVQRWFDGQGWTQDTTGTASPGAPTPRAAGLVDDRPAPAAAEPPDPAPDPAAVATPSARGWHHRDGDPEGVQRWYDGVRWTDDLTGGSAEDRAAAQRFSEPVITVQRRQPSARMTVDFRAKYVTADGKTACALRVDGSGLHMWFGKKYGIYTWDRILSIAFDDPGRTKASVGAIAAFGVLGLARRRAFTLITVSAQDEELYFENDNPIGMWRSAARRIVDDNPAAVGKIYADGQLVGKQAAAPAVAAPGGNAPGWYPDPLGLPKLRWHDGSAWTDHTTPMPQAPQ